LAVQLIRAAHPFGAAPVFFDDRSVDQFVVASRLAVIHAFDGRRQREIRQAGFGRRLIAKRRAQLEHSGWRLAIAFLFDRSFRLPDIEQPLAPAHAVLAEHHCKGRFEFLQGLPVSFIALGSGLDVIPVLAGDHDQLIAVVESLGHRG
jgi:hypothetical protein